MIVDEAELQALPAHSVTGSDESGDTAFDGMHAELALNDRKMCGEREAAFNGCLDEDTMPEREHPWPFDVGESYKVAV